MKSRLERYYVDSVDVYAASETISDTGNAQETYALKLEGVKGSMQARSQNFRNAPQGEIVEADRIFFTAVDHDIVLDDVMKHGEIWYRVTSVANMLDHHIEVLLRRDNGTITLAEA